MVGNALCLCQNLKTYCGCGQGQVAGCSEHFDRPSGFKKCREFHGHLRNNWFLEMGGVPYTYLATE